MNIIDYTPLLAWLTLNTWVFKLAITSIRLDNKDIIPMDLIKTVPLWVFFLFVFWLDLYINVWTFWTLLNLIWNIYWLIAAILLLFAKYK